MSTRTFIDTKAYRVAFLSDKLMHSLKEIVRESGLDPGKLARQWTTHEQGITQWLHSQDLIRVSVEIFHHRKAHLLGRWDVEIIYGHGGDGGMHYDSNPIRELIQREGAVAGQCDYRVLVVAKPGAGEVNGWGDLPEYDVGESRPRRLGYLLWAGDLAVDDSYSKK